MTQIHTLAAKDGHPHFSSVANVTDADKIYVLDRGSIVEEEPMRSFAKNGTYARLWVPARTRTLCARGDAA